MVNISDTNLSRSQSIKLVLWQEMKKVLLHHNFFSNSAERCVCNAKKSGDMFQ